MSTTYEPQLLLGLYANELYKLDSRGFEDIYDFLLYYEGEGLLIAEDGQDRQLLGVPIDNEITPDLSAVNMLTKKAKLFKEIVNVEGKIYACVNVH